MTATMDVETTHTIVQSRDQLSDALANACVLQLSRGVYYHARLDLVYVVVNELPTPRQIMGLE